LQLPSHIGSQSRFIYIIYYKNHFLFKLVFTKKAQNKFISVHRGYFGVFGKLVESGEEVAIDLFVRFLCAISAMGLLAMVFSVVPY